MAQTDWTNAAVNAALMLWMKQQDSKKPNFYPVPMSPEDKRWDDAKFDLFKQGGSPQAKLVQGAGMQYLSQIPSGPSNFKFMSPNLAGQTFAGGVKMPTFDFSKMPGVGASSTATPQVGGQYTVANLPGLSNEERINLSRSVNQEAKATREEHSAASKNADRVNPNGGTPSVDELWAQREQVRTQWDPNQAATDARREGTGFDWRSDAEKMLQGGGIERVIERVREAFGEFVKQHPNLGRKLGVGAITAAITAATGFPVVIVGKILNWMLTGGGEQQGQPSGGGGYIPGSMTGVKP